MVLGSNHLLYYESPWVKVVTFTNTYERPSTASRDAKRWRDSKILKIDQIVGLIWYNI